MYFWLFWLNQWKLGGGGWEAPEGGLNPPTPRQIEHCATHPAWTYPYSAYFFFLVLFWETAWELIYCSGKIKFNWIQSIFIKCRSSSSILEIPKYFDLRKHPWRDNFDPPPLQTPRYLCQFLSNDYDFHMYDCGTLLNRSLRDILMTNFVLGQMWKIVDYGNLNFSKTLKFWRFYSTVSVQNHENINRIRQKYYVKILIIM